MGLSKISQYNEEEMKMCAMSKALAHPARIRIINYLKINNQVDLKDLPALVELAPSTIKAHLRWLEDVDLVSVELVGKKGIVFLLSAKRLTNFKDEISCVNTSATKQLTKTERSFKLQQLTKTKGIAFLPSLILVLMNFFILSGTVIKSIASAKKISIFSISTPLIETKCFNARSDSIAKAVEVSGNLQEYTCYNKLNIFTELKASRYVLLSSSKTSHINT